MPRKKDPNRKPLPPGRPALYPWETWLDGEEHTLRPGVDFFCTPDSLRTSLYKEAKKRDRKISVSVREHAIVVGPSKVDPVVQRRKYDWDKLLDGGIHMFPVDNPDSFMPYAYRVAGDRNKTVAIRTLGNTVILKAEPKS